MQTLSEVLNKTTAFFAKAGIENPKVEAGWLLAGSLGCKRLELFLQHDRPLTEAELALLREQVKRRAAGEPLQYIFGFAEFHGLRIAVGPEVLIPRPETEVLVEQVVQRLARWESPRVIDLGTGSGAIALAIAHLLPNARVLAIDASAAALTRARANAETLGLRGRIAFRRGDWLTGVEVEAEAIVANPPYLSEAEWQNARAEVRDHEPRMALVAAEDGTADLRAILRAAPKVLADGGFVALETGIAHAAVLREFARGCGYAATSSGCDNCGRERFFFAQMGASDATAEQQC